MKICKFSHKNTAVRRPSSKANKNTAVRRPSSKANKNIKDSFLEVIHQRK